jgi:hypothetical protein
MGRAAIALQAMLLAAGLVMLPTHEAHAAKDAFVRVEPHVNAGSLGGAPVEIWFRATAVVLDDGVAAGVVDLRVEGIDPLLYRVAEGRVEVDDEVLVGMTLLLERVGEGGSGGDDDVLVLWPGVAEDELIYDLVGANVHGQTTGTLGFITRRAR